MRSISSGFTLIELTIVVAIIAILAAISLPAYQDYVIRSQIAEGLTLAGGAEVAVWDFTAHHGTLPADNDSAGLPAPAFIAGHYVSAVSVAGGKVFVTFDGPAVNEAIAHGVLSMVPAFDNGGLRWTCQVESGINPRYLPTSCR